MRVKDNNLYWTTEFVAADARGIPIVLRVPHLRIDSKHKNLDPGIYIPEADWLRCFAPILEIFSSYAADSESDHTSVKLARNAFLTMSASYTNGQFFEQPAADVSSSLTYLGQANLVEFQGQSFIYLPDLFANNCKAINHFILFAAGCKRHATINGLLYDQDLRDAFEPLTVEDPSKWNLDSSSYHRFVEKATIVFLMLIYARGAYVQAKQSLIDLIPTQQQPASIYTQTQTQTQMRAR